MAKHYVIGNPVKSGKKGSAAAWEQKIGSIDGKQKTESSLYAEKKSDFTAHALKKWGNKISKADWEKL